MLLTMPKYQRRVEAGEVKRDPDRPSFKALRRVAVGFIIAGLLTLLDWYFNVSNRS